MTRKIILLVLCICSAMNVFAINSLYVGAGATFLNTRPSRNVSSFNGTAPNAFIGYGGWMDDYWYLALEALAVFNPHGSNSNHNNIFDLSSRSRYLYSLSLIPAVNLDNTVILFFRIGAVRASFPDVNIAKNTWQVGAGLEAPVYCNWSIRGEYDYAPFSGIRDIGTVTSNQVSIALVYRFNPILPDAYGLLA